MEQPVTFTATRENASESLSSHSPPFFFFRLHRTESSSAVRNAASEHAPSPTFSRVSTASSSERSIVEFSEPRPDPDRPSVAFPPETDAEPEP